MGESTRRNSTNLRPASLAVTAAALFCMAGTPAAFAQSANGKTGAAAQPPVNTAPASSAPVSQLAAQPGKPGGGKVMHQAGSVPAPKNAPAAGSAPAQPEGAAPAGDPAEGNEKVKVDEHLIVDLHVNDEDLANVLQMLSIQSQKNIVTSKSVSAVVTANLYGVTFYEALDAILHVNGYGYMERGNFIYVYTTDELIKLEQEGRTRVWKVVKLNYLNSTDAAEFVKPLLSEGGQIKTNGKAPNFAISENAPVGAEDYAHDSTMMVFDYEENLGEIEKVIKELDTRPAQVLVEATILQTSLNESNAFGVDFSIINDLSFSDFVRIGGPLQAVDGLIRGNGAASGSSSSGSSSGSGSGTGTTGTAGTPLPSDNKGGALVSSAGNTAGRATLKLGLVWNDVSAFIKMLDEVADTSIISRPNILTLNRQPARVLVGRKVGYLNSTQTTTSTTQTVEFLDTGTQLYFRPFVSSDGSIRMELKPKVSEAVIRNTTSQGGQTVTIPDEISNELTTNVIVRDGQTVVLGGLFRESTTAARRQVPGLGDIPVIGAAFRGREDSTERNEIIFMITPTIIADATLKEQGERGMDMVGRVRAGARMGTLPWSREKRCQQLIMEATDLARDGKREEALAKVQRAISLSPSQPDAIQLREALMNKKENWPTRSMQHEIVKGELEKKLSGKKADSGFRLPAASAMQYQAPRATARPAPEVAVEGAGQVVYTEEPKLPDPAMDPAPAQDPEPVMPEPTPEPDPVVEPMNPAPEPSTEPTPEPAPEPGTEPAPEPSPEPGTEPAPTPEPPKTGPGANGQASIFGKSAAASNVSYLNFLRARHGLAASKPTVTARVDHR